MNANGDSTKSCADPGRGPKSWPDRILAAMTQGLLVIGATALALMMFLTAADVVLRYLFNRPISGALELVEYLMAILIPFSVAYCAWHRSHVAVELVLGRFSKRTQAAVNSLTTLLSMGLALLIVWQNLLYVGEYFRSQMTSSVLRIPSYPFIAPVAIGFFLFALILACRLVEDLGEVFKP